jgi:hypothetical protein
MEDKERASFAIFPMMIGVIDSRMLPDPAMEGECYEHKRFSCAVFAFLSWADNGAKNLSSTPG